MGPAACIRSALLVVVLACLGLHAPAAPRPLPPMQQAFLVQNSGWMEAFYVDPASDFKPLVSRVVHSVAGPQDPVFISAFSQDTRGNPSPALLYGGTGPGRPEQVLSGLAVARKYGRNSEVLADTFLEQAVKTTIEREFRSAPGILWIFTNNRNSRDNDRNTAARNREFYRLLHEDPSIARTLAFVKPTPRPLHGRSPEYDASAVMVYALAHGEPASARLAELVDSGRLASLFPDPPARLKPIDRESVRLVPRAGAASSEVKLEWVPDRRAPDGRILRVTVEASAKRRPEFEIGAAIESLFYPYTLESARATATAKVAGGPEGRVSIRPERLERIEPGEQRSVSVRLPVELAKVSGPFSAEAWRALGELETHRVELRIELLEQRLALSQRFSGRLRELFPQDKDQLLEAFRPPAGAGVSSVLVPMEVRIRYSPWPLVTVTAGVLALLAGTATLGWFVSRPVRYEVVVDGTKRAVKVKPFGSAPVRNGDGTVVGRVERRLGRPAVAAVTEGHTVVVS